MKTGITEFLRKLEIGESRVTNLRTSEVYIIAKRLGITITKRRTLTPGTFNITRIT